MIKRWCFDRAVFSVLLLGALAVILSGCSGTRVVGGDLLVRGAPDWVNQGTGLLSQDDRRLFHGVGLAPPMGDPSLQISTSDNRARAELGRVLSTYMETLATDYMASSGSGDATTEQAISRQINSVIKINLLGAKLMGRWRNPQTNIVYSIVEVDLKQVKAVVSKLDKMNDGLRSYILSNGDNIFDQIRK